MFRFPMWCLFMWAFCISACSDADGALSRGCDVAARTCSLIHKVDNETLISFLVFAYSGTLSTANQFTRARANWAKCAELCPIWWKTMVVPICVCHPTLPEQQSKFLLERFQWSPQFSCLSPVSQISLRSNSDQEDIWMIFDEIIAALLLLFDFILRKTSQ